MKVIVAIPAFNEEKSIKEVISRVTKVMDAGRYNYQVLVVDDGSKDKTAEIAKKAGAVVYSHPKNYGLAETFRTEIEKALQLGADAVVHIDADMQYRAEEIPKLLKEIKNGYGLVIGSRLKGTIEEMPAIKKLGNIAFSKAISNITKLKISDAQSGFRAFTRKVAEEVEITSNHTYTQEQIIRAVKKKFKIKDVPIYFAKREGKSRLISNPFEYAIKAWINIIRVYRDYEPLKFFGTIGGLIFGIGFLMGIYILYLYLTTGIVGHVPLVMLDVLTLSFGLQVIIFGFLADMLKK